MSETLTSKAFKGFQWTTIATILTIVMQVAYTSIMARLLTPNAYGLVAIAQVVLNFGASFSRMGMAQAFVQKEKVNDDDIRSIFTLGIGLALICVTVIWIGAPFFGLFLSNFDPEVVPILRVMSLSFLIVGLSTTPGNILVRKLRFKLLSIIEIVAFVLGYLVIGIGLAYSNFGVWSLVYANLSAEVIRLILVYAFTRHNIIPIFRWKYHRHFLSYGSRITLTNLVELIGANLPTVLIGKFFGEFSLGLFRQAFFVIYLPLQGFTDSLRKVIFPMFSQIQADRVKLKKSYLSSLTIMSAFLFPIGFGMSVASKEIVQVVLGDNFINSYPLLKILAIGAGFNFLTIISGMVCDATARFRHKLIVQIIYIFLLFIAAFSFKSFGVYGVVIVIAISEVVRNFGYLWITGKILNITTKEYFLAYYPGIINGVLVAISIYLITKLVNSVEMFLIVKLALQIIIGAITLVFVTFIKPFHPLREQLRERLIGIPFFANKGKFIIKYL